MVEKRTVYIEKTKYTVVLSDEHEALLAAYAAGRAIVGLWDESNPVSDRSPAEYVIGNLEDADEEFLERVVRRRYGMPWVIARTSRLIVRELTPEDFGRIAGEENGRDGLEDEERFLSYIRQQYRFYEYGIWALEDKRQNAIIGKAGIVPLDCGLADKNRALRRKEETAGQEQPMVELGYHIFAPYRKRGYGLEACGAILSYASSHISRRIYARIDPSNTASIHLAERLGFTVSSQECIGSNQYSCLYEWYCPRSPGLGCRA